MTITEFDVFVTHYPNQRFELVDGNAVVLPQPAALQNFVLFELVRLMWEYIAPHDLGMAFSYSIEYVLNDSTLLIPDVTFISQHRLTSVENRYTLAPDLAVYTLGSGDELHLLTDKARLLLKHGAQLVWLIFPEIKRIQVFQDAQGSIVTMMLGLGDTVHGEAALPGFRLMVDDLFPHERQRL